MKNYNSWEKSQQNKNHIDIHIYHIQPRGKFSNTTEKKPTNTTNFFIIKHTMFIDLFIKRVGEGLLLAEVLSHLIVRYMRAISVFGSGLYSSKSHNVDASSSLWFASHNFNYLVLLRTWVKKTKNERH